MTHDHLCQLADGCVCRKFLPEETECDNCMCECELIRKVRNDEAAIMWKRMGHVEQATVCGQCKLHIEEGKQ